MIAREFRFMLASEDRWYAKRYGSSIEYVLAATCFLCAMGVFWQQQHVSITGSHGDAGSISISIANNPLSFSADNVTITVSTPPGLNLQTQLSSQLGPSPVSPGTTVQFLLNFQIGMNAANGT